MKPNKRLEKRLQARINEFEKLKNKDGYTKTGSRKHWKSV